MKTDTEEETMPSNPNNRTERKPRNLTIDLLKFLFAVLIVLYHSKNLVVDDECTPMFVGGVYAVDFFFLVSGYFFAMSATKKAYRDDLTLGQDTKEFMLHKIARFLPNYYVAWIIAFIVKKTWKHAVSGSMFKDTVNTIWELCFLGMSGIGESYYDVNSVCWYLSAMLISMLILYPLLRKYKSGYFFIIAPIGFLLLYGILYQDFMNLKRPHYFMFGLIMKGTVRAMAEIMLGCILFQAAQALRKIRFTAFARILFTLIEILLWASAIWFLYGHPEGKESKMDYLVVVVFAIALLISFSGISLTASIHWGKAGQGLIGWLGDYSFSLYLSHGFWSQVFNEMSFTQGMTYWEKLPYYLCISACTGLFVMYFSRFLKWFWKKRGAEITKLFIKRGDVRNV